MQVSQPVDYLVADDMILQPDILIVCKPIIKKYLDFPPTLVAEVLSPATALKTDIPSMPFTNHNTFHII
jgi:Uma2 family endonuclease